MNYELFTKYLPHSGKVKVVIVWDKDVNLGEDISRFVTDVTANLIQRTRLEREECRKGKEECDFFNCNLHKAYCCMCRAQSGDVLVSVKANSTIVCMDSNSNINSNINIADGIKVDSQFQGEERLNCNELDYVSWNFVICIRR